MYWHQNQNINSVTGQTIVVDRPKALKIALLPLLKEEIAVHPSLAVDLYNNLGLIYLGNRIYDAACSAFKQAIEMNPGFTGGIENLGDCYFQSGDHVQALQSYKAVLDMSENSNQRLLFKIGLTLTKAGHHSKATEYFKDLLTVFPDFPKARFHLNLCLHKLGWDKE